MAIVGIVIAIIATIAVDQLLKPLIPSSHFLIACLPGLWIAWFFLRQGKEQRFNKLRPRRKKYKLPLPKAFKAITDALDLNTVSTQQWHYLVRSTNERHIKAQVTWTEKNTRVDGHGTGPTNMSFSTVTDTFQHTLQIEVSFQDAGDGSIIVTIDWTPTVGNMNPYACDEVITSTMSAIEANLGEGEDVEYDQPRTYKPGPSLVLLALTGLGMIIFTAQINDGMAPRKQNYEQKKQELADQLNDYKKKFDQQKSEIAEWEAFKRRQGL